MSRLFFHIFHYYWARENHALGLGLPRTSLCRGFSYRGSTVFNFMWKLTLYESVVNFCIQR